MSWLSKLFTKNQTQHGAADRQTAAPQVRHFIDGLNEIRIGRYSDNNKSYSKLQCWYQAEDLFKEKNYDAAFKAFFDYLQDDEQDNISLNSNGSVFTFRILHGTKVIEGSCDGNYLVARTPLALMETPNIPAMRRLLDLNYYLYYSRTAMDNEHTLYMIFDTDVQSANPSKLYYGLRELAVKADRQDELLLEDFTSLKRISNEFVKPVEGNEREVKKKYLKKWAEESLAKVNALNPDSFSGAIAYLLLNTAYRIDFLLTPQGKLLAEIERVHVTYWERKDELSLVERNHIMKDAVAKMADMADVDFAASLYRTKDTFSVNTPPKTEKVREYIVNANRDARWYADNKYPEIAEVINEYGMLYNQFIFSMPKVLTDIITIYMAVAHADFFADLGMKGQLYDAAAKTFSKEQIEQAIEQAVLRYKDKYTSLQWDKGRLSYNSLFDFGVSLSEHMANFNLETKR